MIQSLNRTIALLFVGFLAPHPTYSAATLEGVVRIDGSSTVFPITEAVAEEFGLKNKKVRVNVGVSGTGGGFKKFLAGETDINNASRSIKPSELRKAKESGVEFIEVPVAFDGITVAVNPTNTWVDYLTVAELHKLWKSGSKVKTWADLRKGWPNREIKLFGPGTDSGTFDYFTEVINGESGACRSDFNKSEDDNVLVRGVSGEKDALAFFGFAYYKENDTLVKSVPIKDGNKKAVSPTETTINNGSYTPLSRPVFIYVSKASLKKPVVKEFVGFYIREAAKLVTEVGYVPLTKEKYAKTLNLL